MPSTGLSILYASRSSNSSTTSRLASAGAVFSWRPAQYFCGSTSARLPGSRTASQRSICCITWTGVWSSSMRTGPPPAPRTASSYCGSERSAYSRSPECGTGMAIRGGVIFNSLILNSLLRGGEPGVLARPPRNGRARRPSLHRITSTHALDPGQRFRLPVVPNLHQQQQHQHDRTHSDREREGDVPVSKRQVGRDVLHLGVHHGPQNTQQKRDRERQESQQKRHREYARWNSDPARTVRTRFRHASKLHHR